MDIFAWYTYQATFLCLGHNFAAAAVLRTSSVLSGTMSNLSNFSVVRYQLGGELYRTLFHELLNVPSCGALPDVGALRQRFERLFLQKFGSSASFEAFRKAVKKLTVEYSNRSNS